MNIGLWIALVYSVICYVVLGIKLKPFRPGCSMNTLAFVGWLFSPITVILIVFEMIGIALRRR